MYKRRITWQHCWVAADWQKHKGEDTMSKETRVKGKETLHAWSVLTGWNLRLVLLLDVGAHSRVLRGWRRSVGMRYGQYRPLCEKRSGGLSSQVRLYIGQTVCLTCLSPCVRKGVTAGLRQILWRCCRVKSGQVRCEWPTDRPVLLKVNGHNMYHILHSLLCL